MWETKVRERRRVMSDQVFDLMYNIEERRAAATWRPSEADLAAEASGGESCCGRGSLAGRLVNTAVVPRPHILLKVWDEHNLTAASDIREEDVPTPPRHAEVVDTFATVVGNLSDLAKVCSNVGFSDAQTAPDQLERAKRVLVVQKEIARLPA